MCCGAVFLRSPPAQGRGRSPTTGARRQTSVVILGHAVFLQPELDVFALNPELRFNHPMMVIRAHPLEKKACDHIPQRFREYSCHCR